MPACPPNQLDPGELLVVSGGELGGVSQRLLRSFVVRTQELDPADLAPSLRGDVEPSDLLRERRSFVQCGGAFLVRAACRVDERAPERDQRPREELAVVDASSGRDGAAQTVETGFDRAGGERGLAGLDLRPHCRAPRDTSHNRHLGGGSRRAKSSSRLDAQLASEELGACLDVTRRSLGIARDTQAADEQDVGVLLVGVEPYELRGVMRRVGGLSSREQRERSLMEHGACRPRDVTALALEPHLEAGAGAKDQPLQQPVAEPGQRDRLDPGSPAEDVDVDERSGRQRQPQWIAAELGLLAEPAAQGRESPTERPQRIVGLGKEQARHPLPGRRNPAAKEVREQAPRLVAAGVLDRGPGQFHPRLAQQVDAQTHVAPPAVTRAVTRSAVTVLLVECNCTSRRGREDAQVDHAGVRVRALARSRRG